MQVWETRLRLVCQDDYQYESHFSFKSHSEDYIKYKHSYIESNSSWTPNVIPVDMQVTHYYDNYRAVQGFERELNEDELAELKEKMKTAIVNKMTLDMKDYMELYNRRMKCLEE